MKLVFGSPVRHKHPVDVIEAFALHYDWSFERLVQDEISITVSGDQTDYQISFSWMEEHEALHLACAFGLQLYPERLGELIQLLALINGRIPLGHFDYWQQTGAVVYRQSLLLNGGLCPTVEQIKKLLFSSIEACEARYHAYQRVVLTDISSHEALSYSMFETVGNA